MTTVPLTCCSSFPSLLFTTVAEYNRAQFELFHALGYPAQEITYLRPLGNIERFDLEPLSASDALALAQAFAPTGQDHVKRCIERAQGNPLFLTQLLQAGQDRFRSAIGQAAFAIKPLLDRARQFAVSVEDAQRICRRIDYDFDPS